MRIALVCPYSADVPGGVWTHVLGLAEWLATRGHDPAVVAPGTVPVETAVPVHLVGRARGFPFNGSTARLALAPRQVAAAREIVRGFDVVHVHEPLTPGLAYGVARTARRLVVTHHAHFAPRPPLAVVLRARARRLPERDSLAVSSSAASTALAVTGVRPLVVPNAIRLPPLREKPDEARPLVLFVGRRDDPRKGYRLFEALASRVPAARFVAVGPGRTAGGGAVEVHPSASRGELEGWLSRARVLVAPNTGGESFGMVLVEALAHGCALACSRLDAFRAVVDDDRLVSWFDPGDVEQAVVALEARLADPVDPALAHAAALPFGWENVGPRVEERYRFVALR